MYYGNIKAHDIANGSGIRVSLFVSGCRHRCPDCFNPESWNFHYGQPFTDETIAQLLRLLAPKHIRGLTLLGGEPLEPENRADVLRAVRAVRQSLPGKDIWCYTGFTWPALQAQQDPTLRQLLGEIDVLVDGPFVTEKKDINLRFRGSSNQRIIDLRRTRESGVLTLWTDEFGGQ